MDLDGSGMGQVFEHRALPSVLFRIWVPVNPLIASASVGLGEGQCSQIGRQLLFPIGCMYVDFGLDESLDCCQW